MKKNILLTVGSLSTMMLLCIAQSFDLESSKERGEKVYVAQCMSCHLPNGEGINGVYPPVARANNLADKSKLVKILLKGQRGLIKVNGVEYNGAMTGYPLNNQQAADVINYMRNTWGNKGNTILPSEIQPALKAPVKDYTPF
jgi:nitrite reductase (NO-forming)